MGKRMLFLVPPTLDMGDIAKKMRVQSSTIPYGVLSIITYINSFIHNDIKIMDLNVGPYNDYTLDQLRFSIEERIDNFKPDIVGISAMYNHMYGYIPTMASWIKALNKEILVLAGGCCIMAYYEKLLTDCEDVDAICFAEGELPVLDVLQADDVAGVLDSHPAWLTRKGLKTGKQPRPVFVENLDEIPPIDFELVDISLYGTHRSSFRPVKKDNEVCLPITTTRGCPYNCVFCLAGSLHGKKVRKLSAQRVVSDVKCMVSKYHMNVLSIEDDQFLSDRKRTVEMLEGLSELNISIIADSGFTVMLLDDDIAAHLKRAGLQVATLAIESGSQYVLREIIDKPIQLERVSSVVQSIRDNGLYCHAFLVVGFPGEREVHRQETLEFIKRIGIDWCYITCATPVRGSRLYNICEKNGYINHTKFSENAYYESCINTEDFTAEYITKRAYLMNLELNFVDNYRLRIGDHETAAIYMEHVLKKYPLHAFAHYFLAKALNGINGGYQRALHHMDEFNRIVEQSAEWQEYADSFNLGRLRVND